MGEKVLEKLRQNELEKEWKKRENRWNKEEFARKQLLQNVIDGRMDQISYKQSMKEKKFQEKYTGNTGIIGRAQKIQHCRSRKNENRLKYNKEIQQFLKQQMEEKRKADIEKSKDTAFVDDAEQERYLKMLQQEMEKDKESLETGNSTHHHPRTTANWWTF